MNLIGLQVLTPAAEKAVLYEQNQLIGTCVSVETTEKMLEIMYNAGLTSDSVVFNALCSGKLGELDYRGVVFVVSELKVYRGDWALLLSVLSRYTMVLVGEILRF